MRAVALSALLLVLGPTAVADRFSAAVSGYHTGGCYILAFPIFSPSVEWIDVQGPYPYPTWTEDILSIASADGENVFATVRTMTESNLKILRLQFAPGTPMSSSRSTFFDAAIPGYGYGGAIAVSRTGRVFAGVWPSGSGSDAAIAVISKEGALERVVPAVGPIQTMAAAADGCTILYAYETAVRRVDACTGSALPLFTTADRNVTGLATLNSGDVLLTTSQALRRYDAAGMAVQTFTIPSTINGTLGPVAVSPDERGFVVAAMRHCTNRGTLVALSLRTGGELWRRDTGYISTATGLAVGNEPSAIPALSNLALLVLAGALGGIALYAIRGR